MESSPPLKGFCYIIFAVFIWSGWIVASRYSVKGTLSAYDITAIRFTTAGLFLLPVAFKKGLKIGPWGYGSAFLLSLLLGASYMNIAALGMQFTPASHASTLINGTVLVVTSLAGILLMHEPFTRLRLLGIGIILSGIATIIVVASPNDAHLYPSAWQGHILFILAGCMFGTYTLLAKKWHIAPLHATAIVSVISMLYYMPFYLLLGKSHIGTANLYEVAFQAGYQGILTAVIAFMLFNKGVLLIGATKAGAFVPLVPVISTLIAIPVLHEIPSVYEWIGVFMVSCGVLLASGVIRHRQLPCAS